MKKSDDNKNILFRIHQIKKLSYFEYDYGDLGLSIEDFENPRIDLAIKIGRDNEKGTFIINFKAVYKAKSDIEFLGIQSASVFVIQNHKDTLAQDDCGDYILPQDILNKFAAIAIGATRGMLSILTSATLYQKFVIPPINVEKLMSTANQGKE